MDMTVESIRKTPKMRSERPSRAEAEAAVEVLIRWAGDDPAREGLRETPARYVRAFEEYFCGYGKDPAGELLKTFEDIQGYDDMVLVRDIDFVSHCEHHIAPIVGRASVAYWPDKKVVGISKLARVVDIFARRLTSQESMTGAIADCIDRTLEAKGSAVLIRADHQCMSTRGVEKPASSTVTTSFTGIFRDEEEYRRRFLDLVRV